MTDYRAGLFALALAALVYGIGRVRRWLDGRELARVTTRAVNAEAELERTTAERDRAQLQEAATRDHAADQARGHEAAGEITTHATGRPDADRAALYDRMRDAAHDRRAGGGAGADPAVRDVPGAGATRGPGAGD